MRIPNQPNEPTGLTEVADGVWVRQSAGEVVEHDAHAVGRAALLLADRGVLIAGDLLSDLLIPILAPRRPGQVDAYVAALDRLRAASDAIEVVVPGHGAVAHGPAVTRRFEADLAYLDALRTNEEPDEPRMAPDWVRAIHVGNVQAARL